MAAPPPESIGRISIRTVSTATDDAGWVLTSEHVWTREGGPLFAVSWAFWSEFVELCPWAWRYAGVDEARERFLVTISDDP